MNGVCFAVIVGLMFLVTLAGYYIHSTLVPAIVPKNKFPPSEEIDVKDSFLSNGRGRVG